MVRSNLKLAQTAEEIGGAAMALNVAERDQVDAAMAQTVSELGSLDILVNNAGLYLGYGGPVEQITDEMWQALWSVNVDGVFYCCRAAASIMKEQGGGRIINVASTQARTPGVGVTYDGSKAAVEMITKSLALELAPHGIKLAVGFHAAKAATEGLEHQFVRPGQCRGRYSPAEMTRFH